MWRRSGSTAEKRPRLGHGRERTLHGERQTRCLLCDCSEDRWTIAAEVEEEEQSADVVGHDECGEHGQPVAVAGEERLEAIDEMTPAERPLRQRRIHDLVGEGCCLRRPECPEALREELAESGFHCQPTLNASIVM
jgi:hypothetical protein